MEVPRMRSLFRSCQCRLCMGQGALSITFHPKFKSRMKGLVGNKQFDLTSGKPGGDVGYFTPNSSMEQGLMD